MALPSQEAHNLDVVGDDPTPRRGCARETLKACSPRSRQIVAIEVHHPGPGRDEVLNELRRRIRASVDLGQGPELRVRSEEHTSELQSLRHLVCRLLLDKKK